MGPSFYITRQVEFSAAHRLFRPDLTEAENRELFGACANPYGHGHNYVLDCTIKGPQNPESQMVVHFAKLKRILNELVVNQLDHRHLNHDVPALAGVLPTSENLLLCLWEQISQALKGESWHLYKLKLFSTQRNWVEFFGP